MILFNCAMVWLILSGNLLFAQPNINLPFRERPTWLEQPPTGEYFRYFSGSGSSDASLYYAKREAIYDVLLKFLESGAVSGTEIKTYRVYPEIRDMGFSTSIRGFTQEDDYWEMTHSLNVNTYHYWILMKYPQPEYVGLDLAPIGIKQSFGIAPVIKSLIIPGWGQIHKHEYQKATVFLFGFISTVAAGIISQDISDKYALQVEKQRTTASKANTRQIAKAYHHGSIALFIAAGVIYWLSVYDVLKAEGRSLYANSGDSGISLCYTQVNPTAPQLSLTVYF